jgi:hypothetical protein
VGYRSWDLSLLSTVACWGLKVITTVGLLVQGDTAWDVWHSPGDGRLVVSWSGPSSVRGACSPATQPPPSHRPGARSRERPGSWKEEHR